MDRQRCDETEIKKLKGQWGMSGQDHTEFCKGQGIKYSRFFYWNKQVGQIVRGSRRRPSMLQA